MSEPIQNVSVVNNRQVSVWRGTSEPPTIHHVWIVSPTVLKIWQDGEWVQFVTDPGFDLTSDIKNTVIIGLLNSKFGINVTSSNNSLALTVDGKMITLTSNALTTINATYPLQYKDDQLYLEPRVQAGIYGELEKLTEASSTNTLKVPRLTVSLEGLITEASTVTYVVPSVVEQTPLPPTKDEGVHPILFGDAVDGKHDGVSVTIEGVEYDAATKTLKLPSLETLGILVDGDITLTDNHYFIGNLQGDTEGNATPIPHTSKNPKEFGAGTNTLFGHVLLLDTFVIGDGNLIVPPVAANIEVTYDSETPIYNGGIGVAASPALVYNVYNTLDTKIENNKTDLQQEIGNYFGSDFNVVDKVASIAWSEVD